MAITTAGLLLASGGLQAISAISQGVAAEQQGEYAGKLRDQQAATERELSKINEEDFRRRQSAAMAQYRAAGGKSGVEYGTGSPLRGAEDFAAEVELQARRIRAGGEVRATRMEQEAELSRMAGRSAKLSGFARGGASLLSGYSLYGHYKRPPMRSADPRIGLF